MEDSQNLIEDGNGEGRGRSSRATNLACVAIFFVGCVALITSVTLSYKLFDDSSSSITTTPKADVKMIQSLTTTDSLDFSVFSLMVWGSPGSFGVLDKERRIAALGDWIANDTEHDVYLLNDLWMRPDHGTIRDAVMSRNGFHMTKVSDFAANNCDGVAAPEFCSGLTIVSKHPIKDLQFLPFTDHGDFFWDYEYFLRRGAGLVTLEPSPGHTVAVIVTSLASIDYNYWYRESQVKELVNFFEHSTVKAADHLIVAGDFNVDPRDNEKTYKAMKAVLKNAMKDDSCLDPQTATLGNPVNTYTEKGDHGVCYDYIWYRDSGVTLNDFKVLNLITQKEEISVSDHQALSAKFTLSK